MKNEASEAKTESKDTKITKGDAISEKTGRDRRKMIKMRIQPASVFVDEGEDKIEVGKVNHFL